MRKFVLALARGKLSQALFRRVILYLSRVIPLRFGFLVDVGCLERAAHAYCMWHAASLAKKLGYEEMAVAEFGVGPGRTLLIMGRYAQEIEKELGVRIKVYGFDTGVGLPEIEGVRDLPHWFQPSQYVMDVDLLRQRLPSNTELILGNVRETVPEFFKANRPPLGAVSIDLDLYSSTLDAFRLFDAETRHFLPRIFMYFDDVCGSPLEMYGPVNGELAAVEVFNGEHEHRKIHLNRNLLPFADLYWRYQIYYMHLFDHEKYGIYIGASEQEVLELQLKRFG